MTDTRSEIDRLTAELAEAKRLLGVDAEALDAAVAHVEYGVVPDWDLLREARLNTRTFLSASPSPPAPEGVEPVAWTGSGSLEAIKERRYGFMWPFPAKLHSIPLYTSPAPPRTEVGEIVKWLRKRKALDGPYHLRIDVPSLRALADAIERGEYREECSDAG